MKYLYIIIHIHIFKQGQGKIDYFLYNIVLKGILFSCLKYQTSI